MRRTGLILLYLSSLLMFIGGLGDQFIHAAEAGGQGLARVRRPVAVAEGRGRSTVREDDSC